MPGKTLSYDDLLIKYQDAQNEIDLLKTVISEEVEARYTAWKRVRELMEEVETLKNGQ